MLKLDWLNAIVERRRAVIEKIDSFFILLTYFFSKRNQFRKENQLTVII
jgi:hypothetical protein